MRRPLAAGLLLLLLASCTDDGSPTVGPAENGSSTTSSSGAPASTTTAVPEGSSVIRLTSGAVAPPGGDTDGSGTAVITLVPERAEVCYTLTITGIDAPTGAHLHRGAAGESGDEVLALTAPPQNGTITSCAAGDSILLEELASAPDQFYVDIHTGAFSAGALRGQLQST